MTITLLTKSAARQLQPCPRLPSEPAEDTPVYVIPSNHGLTAHVSYWSGRTLLQLHAQCEDRNGSQCSIMVTLDMTEVEALGRDIAWAESLLQEHNAWMCDATARLLFCQLSEEDTGCYRHLVSCWQGHVCASMRRFFINNQSQLCPTRDGVQYNGEQLDVLRCLLPLIGYDFVTAARTTQWMSEREKDTMPLILVWEQRDQEGIQQPHEEGADEVDSPAPSPCTAATNVASHLERTKGSQEPVPSASMEGVSATPSAATSPAVAPC